jgi:NitT/TauT family transport system substrate-binding protein
MPRLFPALTVGILLTAAATACGGSGPSSAGPNGDQVHVGVIPILDVAPIYLGKAKGFFTAQQIDLSLEVGQGGAAIVPGVVANQLQFGFSNMVSLLLAQSNGLPLKVVSNGVASTGVQGKDYAGLVVKGDSPYKTAADLAGKRIAVNTLKNICETTVKLSIRKAGGDPSGIKPFELAFPDMPAELDAGRADAICVVEPFLSQALANGDRSVASLYVDAAPNLTVAAYFTSQRLLSTNPGLVQRFQTAMAQSLAYADSHPDEVRQILTTYTKIDPKLISKLVLPKWPAEVNRASVQTLANESKQDGLLTKDPDVAALLP